MPLLPLYISIELSDSIYDAHLAFYQSGGQRDWYFMLIQHLILNGMHKNNNKSVNLIVRIKIKILSERIRDVFKHLEW